MKLYVLNLGEGLPPEIRAAWESLVDAERRERVRACKNQADAERSLAGAALARFALARELGCAPSSLVFFREPSGKPGAIAPAGCSAAPYFSVSHSGRFVVCATAPAPVGVDVETKTVRVELAPWFCHPAERALLETDSDPARLRLRLWTLKESWVKCLGTGVGRHMAELDLADALRGAADRPLVFARAGFVFASRLLGGAAVAVCMRG